MTKQSKILGLATIGAVTLGLAFAPGSAQAGASHYTYRTVVANLNGPRGLAFDGRGSLYVAQAGAVGKGAQGQTRTGAVSKFRWAHGTLRPSWSTSFTSVYLTDPAAKAPDALGPAAVSANGWGCRTHHHRHHRGCSVLALLSESKRGIKADTGMSVGQIGHLYRLNAATGRPTDLADVGDQAYAWTARHVSLFKDDFPDANPYAVIQTSSSHRTRTFVADAAANTISRIGADGKAHVISYIPNETSGAHRDATPTCIAQGPDRALYVGTLNLVSNLTGKPGQSNVWRVDPNSHDWRHNAKLWARDSSRSTAAPSTTGATSGPRSCFTRTRQVLPAIWPSFATAGTRKEGRSPTSAEVRYRCRAGLPRDPTAPCT